MKPFDSEFDFFGSGSSIPGSDASPMGPLVSVDASIDAGLQQMYQEFIMDNARRPYGKTDDISDASDATLVHFTASHPQCAAGASRQFNPTCGDEVSLCVAMDGSTIASISWGGHGCSISQASLSVMCQMAEGATVKEFTRMYAAFRDLMNSRGRGIDDADEEDLLGDAMAFQGASQFPMRIKCALLGWEAAKDAIAKALAGASNQDADDQNDDGGEK